MAEYYSILLTLADGAWHPLTDLQTKSGLGRSALMTQLHQFETDGLVFEWSDDQRLRWLNPSWPLCADEIIAGLSGTAFPLLDSLEVFYALESTNSYLHEESAFPHGKACLAEIQRAGRGRRGRRWHSPPCANIYLSLGWRFEATPDRLAGLSLGVGIKLAEVLQAYAQVGLKWPNDLYISNHKLGGILVELKPLSAGGTGVIIGVGINSSMEDDGIDIDQAWTSLHRHYPSQQGIDRNQLVSQILAGLMPFLDGFLDQGDEFVLRRWPEFDVAHQRPVTVCSGDTRLAGIGAGIDAQFQFRLRHAQGVSSFSSAQVSLRL